MKQIITGPMGRVVYHNAGASKGGQYPAMNVPDCGFARADALIAANQIYSPNVIPMPRKNRQASNLALFGTPAKRKN